MSACSDDAGDGGEDGSSTLTTNSSENSGEADSGSSDVDGGTSQSDSGTSGDADGGSETTGDGDGDGDSSTSGGDGDSNTSGGDGDSSTSGGDGDSGTSGGDGDSTTTSSGGDGDGTTGNDCLECTLSLSTTASCTLEGANNNSFLAEMYLDGELVYAIDEVQAGRVIFTGDSNILNLESTDCPLYEWLGQTGSSLPTIASIGSNTLCAGTGNNLAAYSDWTYLGQNMPAQYLNDAAQLKADYDVVIYCPLRSLDSPVTMNANTPATLIDYVTVQGGGLYLVGEYFSGGLGAQGFTDINLIANPLGANYLQTNLAWGPAGGEVVIGCFPLPE